MFEQKIKETTVQIYGILHMQSRLVHASKLISYRSAICHIFAQPESLDESWNDLFYIVPTTHLLWYQNKECRMCHYTMLLPRNKSNYCIITRATWSGK